MTGTPSERAALLSARIHREINAGRFNADLSPVPPRLSVLTHLSEVDVFYRGWIGTIGDEEDVIDPFFRLGGELRAIAVGNREGSR